MSNGKGNRVASPWCAGCGNPLRQLDANGLCAQCYVATVYPDHDVYWDDDNEPTGSCDECGCNLYRDDDWDGLCNQCAWACEQGGDEE